MSEDLEKKRARQREYQRLKRQDPAYVEYKRLRAREYHHRKRSEGSRERWLPIAGTNGMYEVSDWGRVRTWRRIPCVLKPRISHNGYQRVGLYRGPPGDKRATQHFVHRLVLETFTGPCPPGMECDHRNRDKTDNRLSNIRWCTRRENCDAKTTRGSVMDGSRHLEEHQVLEVRARYAKGESQAALSRAFGVKPLTIYRIVTRRTWADLWGTP